MVRSHVEAEDEEDDNGSSSSSDESSSSSENRRAPINVVAQKKNITPTDEDDGSEQRQVKNWTIQIPIGLGLCPWASKSHNQGNLRYVTCTSETPRDVAIYVQREIQRLVCSNDGEPPPWSTTLVICPHVNEWNESFPTFDKFVSHDIWEHTSTSDEITLVAFHPNFLRWHGLPDNITKGSVVQCHYGIVGKMSAETAPATIVETCNKAFGMRRVKVRFHTEETINNAACHAHRQEQYVPTDWISTHEGGNKRGPALPDNAMHQAPYPTIHIINNTDLASLSIRDISRVKRKNAHCMMKLGWDGIEKKLNLISTHKL